MRIVNQQQIKPYYPRKGTYVRTMYDMIKSSDRPLSEGDIFPYLFPTPFGRQYSQFHVLLKNGMIKVHEKGRQSVKQTTYVAVK